MLVVMVILSKFVFIYLFPFSACFPPSGHYYVNVDIFPVGYLLKI